MEDLVAKLISFIMIYTRIEQQDSVTCSKSKKNGEKKELLWRGKIMNCYKLYQLGEFVGKNYFF